jgi:hypothetical protein
MTRPTTTGKAQDLITFTRSTTGTYLGSDGLLKSAAINEARIEYDASGNCLGLLVEEARTNLFHFSENFAGSYWTKGTITVSATNAIAPDGSASADKIVPNANNDRNHIIYKDMTSSPLDAFSLFVKPAGFDYVSLILQTSGSADAIGVQFNLLAGTVVTSQNANGIIQDVGNGWYRVTVTPTTSSTFYYAVIQPNDGSAPNTSDFFRSTFAGNGSDGVYLWGAQFEQGSFPTSYIPTSGSTVTRAADVASLAVSEFGYNQDQGTVVIDWNTLGYSTVNNSGVLYGGASNARWIYSNINNTTHFSYDGTNSIVHGSIPAGQQTKLAMSVDSSTQQSSINGNAIASASHNGNIASNTSVFNIGHNQNAADLLTGHIKSIQYYPLRLSNAQLQALTV